MLLLLFGLGELTSQVKKAVAVAVVLLGWGYCPVSLHVGLIKPQPANLTVHEVANDLVHGGRSALTRNPEENFQPLRRSLGVVGSEDGVAYVQIVFELLLICLAPGQCPDLVGRTLQGRRRETSLRGLNRRVGVFVRLVEVYPSWWSLAVNWLASIVSVYVPSSGIT